MDDQSLSRPLLGGSNIPPNSETFFIVYRPQTQATQATFNFILAFVAMKLNLSKEAGKAALRGPEVLSKYLTDEELKLFDESEDSQNMLKELEKELKELDEMHRPCLTSREFAVPQEIVYSITDVILERLKDEYFKDFEKKEEIEMLLGNSLSSEEFNELVDLGKKITDYVMYEDEMDEDEMDEDEMGEDEMDEEEMDEEEMDEEDEAITP